ncbi:MAG: type II toxin-antitoxin system HicB family antitoxin [Verrucomicrobiia bacterium]|jgi:predicted RNase H-like HicB family nuclease
MSQYEIIMDWSDEDHCFVVKVPDLPGCMAHGDTRAEAATNAEGAIDAWLATAEEFGRAIPEPRSQLALAPAED